jgi:hypothetical protein
MRVGIGFSYPALGEELEAEVDARLRRRNRLRLLLWRRRGRRRRRGGVGAEDAAVAVGPKVEKEGGD